MIPNLQEIARDFDVDPLFVAFVVADVLTGFVLLAQPIARWFDDRHS